jgi:hypothetical protein
MIVGWYLDILFGYLIRTLLRFVNLWRSAKWPVVTGAISSATCPPAPSGGPMAVFGYTYIHNGHYYSGVHRTAFLLRSSAEDYVNGFVIGTQIGVRVKPSQAEKSVVVEL